MSLTPLPPTLPTGNTVTHAVRVTNAGPGTAAATALTFRVSGGGGVTTAPVGCNARAAGEWLCALGDLAAGAAMTLDWGLFTFAPGPLDVNARIASATTDPSPGNDSATSSSNVLDLPDLSLGLEAAPPPSGVTGSGLRAVVFNGGRAAASQIRLLIALPPGLWFTGSNRPCAQDGALLTCPLGDLAAESGPATVVVGLAASHPGSHTLLGSVSALEADANPTNDSGSLTLAIAAGQPPLRHIPSLPAWALATLATLLLARGLRGGNSAS